MANTIKLKQIDQTQLAAFVNELIDGTGLVYTASRAVVTDSSGDITTSSVTSTELGYVSGVTSSIQTQISAKFTLPSLTSGSILFSNGTTISQDNSNLFWNNTSKKLGIGTTSPSTKLHLKDTSATQITFEGATSYTGTIGLTLTSVTSSNRPDIVINGGLNDGYNSSVWLATNGINLFTARRSLNNVTTITAGNAVNSSWTHTFYDQQSGGTPYDVFSFSSSTTVLQLSGPNLAGVEIYSHVTKIASFTTSNTLFPYNSSFSPLIVRGAVSQTANLTQWQNSSSTVLAYIESDGTFCFGTHSTIGAETLSGFITIKDSGGTTRKLAVIS